MIQNSPNTVRIPGTNNTLNFILHDDDIDFPTLPRLPDTTLLPTAAGQAYVVPVFDLGALNVTPTTPFVANIQTLTLAGATNANGIIGAQRWDTQQYNANDFWVAYLLGAFQADELLDADPAAEATRALGGTPNPVGGSLIFFELHQTHEGVANPTSAEQDTVDHEVAHALGNRSVPSGGDFENACCGGVSSNGIYSPIYLDYIRRSVRPLP